MKRIFAFLPLVVAAIIGGFAMWGLQGGRDPSSIPSALLSQPAPAIDLPGIAGFDTPGLNQDQLRNPGKLTLVNVFASWCGPCRAEHPLLTQLALDDGLVLVGINYKDKADAAIRFLDELGNPYERIGADTSGRAGIDWGVTGVPETFVIDENGVILYREAGPLVSDGLRRMKEAIELAKGAS